MKFVALMFSTPLFFIAGCDRSHGGGQAESRKVVLDSGANQVWRGDCESLQPPKKSFYSRQFEINLNEEASSEESGFKYFKNAHCEQEGESFYDLDTGVRDFLGDITLNSFHNNVLQADISNLAATAFEPEGPRKLYNTMSLRIQFMSPDEATAEIVGFKTNSGSSYVSKYTGQKLNLVREIRGELSGAIEALKSTAFGQFISVPLCSTNDPSETVKVRSLRSVEAPPENPGDHGAIWGYRRVYFSPSGFLITYGELSNPNLNPPLISHINRSTKNWRVYKGTLTVNGSLRPISATPDGFIGENSTVVIDENAPFPRELACGIQQ